MLHKILKGIAPIVALSMGGMTAGCNGTQINIGDDDGVPLAELDMSGAAPTALALAGPDSVVVTKGDSLSIEVEGDEELTEALRFSLDDQTLGISRKSGFSYDQGKATVRVTMPAPGELVLAGSGTIAAETMAPEAQIVIAGSGRIDVASLKADKLDLNVMGSGTAGAAGSAGALDLTIAGSGRAELDELSAETADVSIMGSGSGAFASDGKVDASIMGSGDVTVFGRAECTVSAMGSGKLRCKSAGDADEQQDEAAG
jgi:hypothetical protein